MVDLTTQFKRLESELVPALLSAASSGQYIQGSEVREFASELQSYLGIKHVIPCANGTDALQIALMALDLPKDAEVLVPAFNYVATAEVIALLGLKPVFVEVEDVYFGMDVTKLESYLTPNTRVIMPVHLFGQVSQMDAIMAFATRHKLFIIEDVAQAIAAKYTSTDGSQIPAGGMGHISTTSFFPTKNLGCMGDGGAIFTNDEVLATKLYQIANHGQLKKYDYIRVGVNSRLDTIQAAGLRVKLRHLDSFIKSRTWAADSYDNQLAGLQGIEIPARAPWSSHVFHQYTLKVAGDGKRDELKLYLQEQGIPSMIYYPGCIHLQKAYEYLGYQKGDFPVGEKLSQTVLSLPMHTELKQEQIDFICKHVAAWSQMR